jgi:hypothetical protein
MNLHAEVLLSLVVQIKQSKRTLPGNGERIEDMISAVNRKVRFDHAGLLESHIGANDAVEFRLQMSVRDEKKREGFLRRRNRSCNGGRDRCGEAGGSEQREELPAAGCVHHNSIISRRQARSTGQSF